MGKSYSGYRTPHLLDIGVR